jgi:hypothetical protein
MEKDRFIFYRSFAEAIDDLPDDEQLKIYKAIKEYALNEREVELTGIAKSFWKLIKPQITANNRRYQNGTRGGKKSKEEEPKGDLELTKAEPNVNENENENEKSPSPDFSLTNELNQPRKDLVSRVEGRRKKWESCELPPAPIITNIGVLNDLNDCFGSYADEKIDETIKNFAGVITQKGFDISALPGGLKPNFKNFLLRWVDRFIDEAKPFETFKPKHGTSPPGRNQADWERIGSMLGREELPEKEFKDGLCGKVPGRKTHSRPYPRRRDWRELDTVLRGVGYTMKDMALFEPTHPDVIVLQ